MTTLRAPIIAPSPIITPFKITTSNPIQTLSAIVIGADLTPFQSMFLKHVLFPYSLKKVRTTLNLSFQLIECES